MFSQCSDISDLPTSDTYSDTTSDRFYDITMCVNSGSTNMAVKHVKPNPTNQHLEGEPNSNEFRLAKVRLRKTIVYLRASLIKKRGGARVAKKNWHLRPALPLPAVHRRYPAPNHLSGIASNISPKGECMKQLELHPIASGVRDLVAQYLSQFGMDHLIVGSSLTAVCAAIYNLSATKQTTTGKIINAGSLIASITTFLLHVAKVMKSPISSIHLEEFVTAAVEALPAVTETQVPTLSVPPLFDFSEDLPTTTLEFKESPEQEKQPEIEIPEFVYPENSLSQNSTASTEELPTTLTSKWANGHRLDVERGEESDSDDEDEEEGYDVTGIYACTHNNLRDCIGFSQAMLECTGTNKDSKTYFRFEDEAPVFHCDTCNRSFTVDEPCDSLDNATFYECLDTKPEDNPLFAEELDAMDIFAGHPLLKKRKTREQAKIDMGYNKVRINKKKPQKQANTSQNKILQYCCAVIFVGVACIGTNYWDGRKKFNFSNITTSLKNMQTSVTSGKALIETAAEWIAINIFGDKSQEDTINEDALSYVTKLDTFSGMPLYSLVSDPMNIPSLRRLIADANSFISRTKNLKPSISTLLNHSLETSKAKLSVALEVAAAALPRPATVGILVQGERAAGKTTAGVHILSTLDNALWGNRGIYNIDGDVFYQEYVGQRAFQTQEAFKTSDLTQDRIAKDANSIMSNMAFNMAGAFDKRQPCGGLLWHIDTNTPFDVIAKNLDMEPESKRAFFNRLQLFVAAINPDMLKSGEIDLTKPRGQQGHKEDFSHIVYYPYRLSYNNKDVKFEKWDTLLGGKPFFTVKDMISFCKKQVDVAQENFLKAYPRVEDLCKQRDLIPQKQMESAHHCVVSLSGPSGSGKGTFLTQFKRYIARLHPKWHVLHNESDWITFNAEYAKIQHRLHKGEKGIFIISDATDSAEDQKTYAEFYNRLVPGQMIVHVSNHRLEREPSWNPLKTIYKGFAYNEKFYRRAGFSGLFRLSEGSTVNVPDVGNTYIVEEFQHKRTLDGHRFTGDEMCVNLLDTYCKYMHKIDDVAIEEVDVLPELDGEPGFSFNFSTMAEFQEACSTYTGFIKAALTGSAYVGPRERKAFASIPANQLMYPGKLQEDYVGAVKHYALLLRRHGIATTGRFFVADTGKAMFNGSSLYVVKFKEEQKPYIMFDDSQVVFGIGARQYEMPLKAFVNIAVLGETTCPEYLLLSPGVKELILDIAPFLPAICTKDQAKRVGQVAVGLYREKFDARIRETISRVANFLLEHKLLVAFAGVLVGIYALRSLFTPSKKGMDAELLNLVELKMTTPQRLQSSIVNNLDEYTPEAIQLAQKVVSGRLAQRKRSPRLRSGYDDEISGKTPAPRPRPVNVEDPAFSGPGWVEDESFDWNADLGYDALAKRKGPVGSKDYDTNPKITPRPAPKPVNVDDKAFEGPGWAEDPDFDWGADLGYDQLRKSKSKHMADNADWNDRDTRYVENAFKSIRANLVKVTTKPGFFDSNLAGGSLFGLGVSGRYLICPRHVTDGTNGKEVYVEDERVPGKTFVAKVIEKCTDRDLLKCEITDRAFPLFKNIINKFPTREENVVVQGTPITFCRVHKGLTEFHYGETVFVCKEPHDLFGDNQPIKDWVDLSCSFGTDTTSFYGDCGLPYLSNKRILSGQSFICGIHIGGYTTPDMPAIAGSIVYRDDLAFAVPKSGFSKHTADFDMVPEEEELWENMIAHKHDSLFVPDEESTLELVGTIPLAISSVPKSKYQPSRISNKLSQRGFPPLKVPTKTFAELLPEELELLPRNAQGVPSQALLQFQMFGDKLSNEAAGMQEDVVEELLPWFVQEFGKSLEFSMGYEVLNGISKVSTHPLAGKFEPIETSTSAGYTLQTLFKRTNKSAFIVTDPETGHRTFARTREGQWVKARFLRAFSMAREGKRSFSLFKTCCKSELLKEEKAYKARTFECEDLVGVLLERAVLGKWVSQNTVWSPRNSCRVGIDPIAGFDALARYHLEVEHHFDGDYKRWDKHVNPVVFRIAEQLFKRAHQYVMNKHPDNCQWCNAMSVVLDNACNSYHVVLNCVVKKCQGIPSGLYLTAALNSLLNYISVYACFKHIASKQGRIVVHEDFLEHCRVSTYGDDLLVSVSNEVRPWFHLKSLADASEYLFTHLLDTATKDGKMFEVRDNLTSCTFLSRHFTTLPDRNFYLGALKKESVEARLHWISRDINTPEQLGGQISDALFEAAIWGKDYYDRLSRAINLILMSEVRLRPYVVVPQYSQIVDYVYRVGKKIPTDGLLFKTARCTDEHCF
uniref:RNA dependent RNA polymerase n=1 Tax=Xiangshan picorna-like virus 7 TaxID=2886223 RepID=A0A8K1P3J0_9VIRU|nr:MAG: RNA dependent RNA polymerase [Xiangshan picorna-like virus 7]